MIFLECKLYFTSIQASTVPYDHHDIHQLRYGAAERNPSIICTTAYIAFSICWGRGNGAQQYIFGLIAMCINGCTQFAHIIEHLTADHEVIGHSHS